MSNNLPEGVAADGFASRPLTAAMIEEADVVLTAEDAHRTRLLEDHPRAFRKVFTLGQFAEASERSELRGRALIESLGSKRAAARPEHDVQDPYRRGPEAATEAAAHITRLLERVIPALTRETR